MEGPHGDIWLHSWGGYLFWNAEEEDYYDTDGNYIDHGTSQCIYCYCTYKETDERWDEGSFEEEVTESGTLVSADAKTEERDDEDFEELRGRVEDETDDVPDDGETPEKLSDRTELLVKLTDYENLCDGYAAGFLEGLLAKNLEPAKSVASRPRRQSLSDAGWAGRTSDTRTFADAIAAEAGLELTFHDDWEGAEAFQNVVDTAKDHPDEGVYLSIYTTDGAYKHDMSCAFMDGEFYVMDSKQGVFWAADEEAFKMCLEEAYKKYSERASGVRRSRREAEVACSVMVVAE